MAALLPWLPRVHRQAAARGHSASCRRDPKRGLRHRTLRLPPHAKGSSGNGGLGWIIYLGSPPAILSPCIPHASSILYLSCISSRARNGTHASKYGVSNTAQRRQRPPQPLAHLPCPSRAPPVHLPCTPVHLSRKTLTSCVAGLYRCAQALLKHGGIFPLRHQVDVAVSNVAWPPSSRFALDPNAVSRPGLGPAIRIRPDRSNQGLQIPF